jgi:hypothetical protein
MRRQVRCARKVVHGAAGCAPARVYRDRGEGPREEVDCGEDEVDCDEEGEDVQEEPEALSGCPRGLASGLLLFIVLWQWLVLGFHVWGRLRVAN